METNHFCSASSTCIINSTLNASVILKRNEKLLKRNETHLERNKTRLERNDTRLARNETESGNLHLSGTVHFLNSLVNATLALLATYYIFIFNYPSDLNNFLFTCKSAFCRFKMARSCQCFEKL